MHLKQGYTMLLNLEELQTLKNKYDDLFEQQRAFKEQIISYLKNLGSVSMQHDEVDNPKEGAPCLIELPTVNYEHGYEIHSFAIVGSKLVDNWLEFQLVAQGEVIAETTIDDSDFVVTIEVLMEILEAYRYWSDHLQQTESS